MLMDEETGEPVNPGTHAAMLVARGTIKGADAESFLRKHFAIGNAEETKALAKKSLADAKAAVNSFVTSGDTRGPIRGKLRLGEILEPLDAGDCLKLSGPQAARLRDRDQLCHMLVFHQSRGVTFSNEDLRRHATQLLMRLPEVNYGNTAPIQLDVEKLIAHVTQAISGPSQQQTR